MSGMKMSAPSATSGASVASASGVADDVALGGRLVARDALDSQTHAAMFALMGEHFRGVAREVFEADLAEKNWVILLEDRDGRLRGFSTLLVQPSDATGERCVLVYSGDTIVDRAAWGTRVLPKIWIDSALRLCARYPDLDAYWLLLTSGFRTYRFLPVFYQWFYPRFDEPTPAEAQRAMDAFAHERFGARYDAARGIVRFARPQVLRPDLLAVPDGRRVDPHIDFFLARNPGFVDGDELVCLTRVSRANLTPAGRRMLR